MESTAVPATTVKSARKRLGSLVREVNDATIAVAITGKRDQAVLISLERYTALQEATFLLRSPELMDSLRRQAERSLPAPGSATGAAAATSKAAGARPAGGRKKPKARKRKK